jgi:immune inhibitor A
MSRDCCGAPPHPEVLAARRAEEAARAGRVSPPPPLGFDDGVIVPPDMFPVGTPRATIATTAARRAPLRGNLNVIVVLAEFRDRRFTRTPQQIEELFFSTGVIPTGSVHEYYHDVSSGLVSITGHAVGPFEMPLTLAEYAHGNSGEGLDFPNTQTLGRDAAKAAMPHVNFSSFDNDSNGFVDALVVVHAGSAAERTNSRDDLSSVKRPVQGGELIANNTSILQFLTVAEDSPMGIAAHELGHLLFGWPDLYDRNFESQGAGNWCLMAHGAWNGPAAGAGDGELPAHPSAWCKMTQGWVNTFVQRTNGTTTVEAVQESKTIHRLWKDGMATPEFFLLENRQRTGFDSALPGDGLLIWHVDESRENNDDVTHPKVALMQADGNADLQHRGDNFGDANDPFRAPDAQFNDLSNPSSRSYSGLATSVSVKSLSPSAPRMDVQVDVTEVPQRPPTRGRIVGH